MIQHKLVFFMPSIEGGGVEKNMFIICNYFANKLNNIHLITASKKYSNKFNKKIRLICPKLDMWDKLGRRFKYLICLFLLLKLIFKEKNISVFCFQANIYCIILCRIFKIKIIVRSNSSPFGWSKNSLKNFIFRKVLKKATGVIANSEEFKKILEKKFKIKVSCIYNPLNKYEILKLSKVKTKKIFNNTKSIKIINVGRFVDQKDQITLLKAINIIKHKINLEVKIVGRGIEKQKLKNFINKNKLEKIVRLIDFKDNPFPYIKASKVFILTSKFEGLPNVLLEAITLNKFVISSNCSTGPNEILDKGKGGLLYQVGDYRTLANKVLFYAKNKSTCKKKLKYARKRLSRFDYNKNLNLYFKMVNKILI